MNLEELKHHIFVRKKVPYYIKRWGKTTTCTVFDKEGMNTYIITGERQMLLKHFKPLDEVTEDDLVALNEAFERLGVEKGGTEGSK